jgi:O-antigen/teichoic acid export membrane protein
MEGLRNKVSTALRSSESLLKLDVAYLIKGGLWTSLSFLIGTLASLVMMIAFGNLLPRETYGTYNYLLSLGASLSFLTLSGVGTGVMRAVARGHENVVPVALRLQLRYNLIAVATVLTAAAYYGYKGNDLFAYSLVFLAVAYPISEAFHLHVNVLTGRKRFDTLTKISSVITLASTLATLTTLLLTKNVLTLIAVYSLISILPNLIVYSFITRDIPKMPPEEEQVREMRRTAFHITGAGLIGAAAQYIDKIVLFQVAGPAALAIYTFAGAGPERLKGLVKSWVSIAAPQLAQRSLGEIRRVVYRRIGFAMLVGMALFLCYLFIAPILFKLFLPRYLDAILYSQILALALIVTPATIFIGSIFSSQNMLRAIYALSIGTQVVRIILFLAFGWLWQIWGLVIASLLSAFIHAVYGLIIWEVETRRLIKKNESF